MVTSIILTVYNEDFGTASVVADIGTSYSVALFDVDAEKYVPGACTTFPKTMINALELATGKAMTI